MSGACESKAIHLAIDLWKRTRLPVGQCLLRPFERSYFPGLRIAVVFELSLFVWISCDRVPVDLKLQPCENALRYACQEDFFANTYLSAEEKLRPLKENYEILSYVSDALIIWYKLLIAPSSKRTFNHSFFSTPDMLCVQDIVADSPGSYTICWSATPSSWHGKQLLLEKRNTSFDSL